MTIEQQVDALTASVDNLMGAVVSKKATLDASVVDAQSATAQAQAAKANAFSARDQAEAFKDAAYTAAQSAASAVAYQDLSAVALTKAVTAIDVFIYDTSKDSDGGAWRHRCAGASWFNEPLNTATRGARREFPAVAVIVAEASKITIYDGDDPALPVWKIYSAATSYTPFLGYGDNGSLSSVTAINGTVSVTSKSGAANQGVNGLFLLNFPGDMGRKINATHNRLWPYGIAVSQAPVVNVWLSVPSIGPLLVGGAFNDVAMTVLPDAPIDPATGVPVHTIAVATAGGVSVIKDDGIVVDITGYSAGIAAIGFTEENRIYVNGQFQERLLTCDIPSVDVDQIAAPNRKSYEFYGGTPRLSAWKPWHEIVSVGDSIVVGSNSTGAALNIVHEKLDDLSSSMVAYTTSTYNTGWLPGDIKGAFLADTDDTDLVGSGELVVNGGFDDGPTGWVDFSEGAGSISVADGRLSLVNGGAVNGDNEGMAYQMVPTVVGQRYQVTVDKVSGSSIVQIGYGAGVAQYFQSGNDSNDVVFSFVAATTTTFITTRVFSANTTAVVEAVSVRIADADRSVNARGLVVNGTITRAPVAPGAELVAYNGFSASNYLEQPYNPDLDFGTGDFCMMGWYRGGALNSTGTFFARQSAPNNGFHFFKDTATDPSDERLAFRANGATYYSSIKGEISKWLHVVALRRNGVLEIYQDAVLGFIGPMAGDISDLRPSAFIGYNPIAPTITVVLGMALWRVGGTAPTADQIRRIYEDEKALFQENAACTLYGVSDAVTALAHDPDTGMLHVGTSAGRSVFKGLRRVANTTAPVATAIAAAGDLVVEQ